MILTEAQREAVNWGGNAHLVACPGSGKTRAITAKLLKCVDEVRDSSRKIGCITYTNAGVSEIEYRLGEHGRVDDDSYCDVHTIHSFCLNNVLGYFYWRTEEYKKGYVVLPPDSEIYREITEAVCRKHRLDARARDSFELLNRKSNGQAICPPPLTSEIASEFWHHLSEQGYIDFPNIIYWSYELIRRWADIRNALACRYAWILVDEYQDTTELQIELLRAIAEEGRTHFFW